MHHLEFEMDIPMTTWDPWVALCIAQGEDADEALINLCLTGMTLSLEDALEAPEEARSCIDPTDREEAYEDALEALANYFSARYGYSIHQGRYAASKLLDDLS